MKDFSRYLEIPYRDGGRDFSGCDCWGLVRLFLLEEFKIELDNFEQYSCKNLEEVKRIAEKEKGKFTLVPPPGKPGDIIELSISPRDWHIGVIADEKYILHISEGAFPEMTPENSRKIVRRIKGYWRHRALL